MSSLLLLPSNFSRVVLFCCLSPFQEITAKHVAAHIADIDPFESDVALVCCAILSNKNVLAGSRFDSFSNSAFRVSFSVFQEFGAFSHFLGSCTVNNIFGRIDANKGRNK